MILQYDLEFSFALSMKLPQILWTWCNQLRLTEITYKLQNKGCKILKMDNEEDDELGKFNFVPLYIASIFQHIYYKFANVIATIFINPLHAT